MGLVEYYQDYMSAMVVGLNVEVNCDLWGKRIVKLELRQSIARLLMMQALELKGGE